MKINDVPYWDIYVAGDDAGCVVKFRRWRNGGSFSPFAVIFCSSVDVAVTVASKIRSMTEEKKARTWAAADKPTVDWRQLLPEGRGDHRVQSCEE